MSKLNVSLDMVAYLDALQTQNPLNRLANVKYSLLGMNSGVPRMVPINLAPGQSQTFANLARTLSYTGSTTFGIEQVVGTDFVRLTGAFGARTARSYGDATTQWVVSRTNNTVRLTYGSTGTAPTFNTMQPGDGLTIEAGSAFNPQNWGDFVVTDVGASYVEFQNPIGVAETVVALVDVYSSGPVQVGDYLDISSSVLVQANRGTFQITRVTDRYVQFANANAVPQAENGITTGISIYPQAYSWMLLSVDQRVVVRLNGDSGSSVEVEPPSPGDLSKEPGILLKRGRTYQVDVVNPSAQPVTGFVLLCT